MFGGETRRPRHPPPSSSRGDGSSSFAARLARRSRVSAARIDPARRDHAAHVESRWTVENPMSRSMLMPSGSRTRSEEHTSELQSLMRISYAVFCLKKKKKQRLNTRDTTSKKNNIKEHKTDTQD